MLDLAEKKYMSCDLSTKARNYMKERFDVLKRTKTIDFSKESELIDPTTADACVRVCTSDGHVGSLSHLSVDENPEQFARDLRDFLGKDGIPAVLNGGMGNWEASIELVERLTQALIKNGFLLSKDPDSSDVLGQYSREATIKRDRVCVTRYAYCENPTPEKLSLKFPKKNR